MPSFLSEMSTNRRPKEVFLWVECLCKSHRHLKDIVFYEDNWNVIKLTSSTQSDTSPTSGTSDVTSKFHGRCLLVFIARCLYVISCHCHARFGGCLSSCGLRRDHQNVLFHCQKLAVRFSSSAVDWRRRKLKPCVGYLYVSMLVRPWHLVL
jgi:hypothetical protein